jgi:hypothetical protein
MITSSSALHCRAHLNESFSPSEIMISPLAVMDENALRGVFLTNPCDDNSTKNLSSSNELTGMTDVMWSLVDIGST